MDGGEGDVPLILCIVSAPERFVMPTSPSKQFTILCLNKFYLKDPSHDSVIIGPKCSTNSNPTWQSHPTKASHTYQIAHTTVQELNSLKFLPITGKFISPTSALPIRSYQLGNNTLIGARGLFAPHGKVFHDNHLSCEQGMLSSEKRWRSSEPPKTLPLDPTHHPLPTC